MSEYHVSDERPARRSVARTASGWLPGLVLGSLTGLVSISFALGVLALPLLAASIGVIAWKGPRLMGFGGFLTGFGLLWLVLLLRVQLTCGAEAVFPDEGCSTGDLSKWLAAAFAIFVAGLAGSGLALRQKRALANQGSR